MKKNWLSDSLDPGIITKIFRAMRLTIILLLGIIFTANANDSYSQAKRMDVQLQNSTITAAFDYIEHNSEFIFLYKDEDLDLNKPVNIDVENANIEEILAELLQGSDLTYNIYDRQVIIRKTDGLILDGLQDQKTVTGVVTDQTGVPMPGVTIVVPGTTIGTITNDDGSFTLAIPDDTQELQVSFVGMVTQLVSIEGKTTVAISMEEEKIGLDEVVVVGYGTQISRQVTGSVQQMDADELEDLPVAQVTQKLQGKMAGVQINQASGTPGEGMKVRIRGQASINSGNDPLYVVDGFPIVGDISNINPDEIENISVLKDAASTSLYGSRAANGVILITTKSGKAGQSTINFNAYYGFQEVPQKGRPEMMNATEFATWLKERYEDVGDTPPDYLQNPSQYGKGTDWYDFMLQKAPIQNYNLTLTSSNDKVRATGVLGYFKQEGVMKKSDYERFSFRLNSEFQVIEPLKIGINIAPTYSIRNTPNSDGAFYTGGILYNAMLTNPMVSPVNEDGTIPLRAAFPGIGFGSFPNPYRALVDITNETKDLRLLANAFAEFTPIEGLTLKSSVNVDMGSTYFLNFQPTTTSLQFWVAPPRSSQSTRHNTTYATYLNENLATYSKQFGDHSISALAGFTIQQYNYNREQIVAQEFSDDRIMAVQTAASILTGAGNTSTNIQDWSLISYLARVNYNYQGKYLITAAIRRDGSSRFGENNRWGNFPSVSAGWVISDEGFMADMEKLSFMKLRASYGVVGNNNVGNYTQYSNVSITNNVVFNGAQHGGAAITGIQNKDLGWETTKQIDVGIDVALFDNRLSFTYDYYTKRTTDLLYNVDVPQESGFSNISANLGEFKFWGHEITLASKNLVGDLKWDTDFNISFNRNEAVSLIPGVDRLYAGGAYGTITMPGEPIGQFYGMDWIGVYENQADFDNSPVASRSGVGTIKFRDVNGDGVITNGGDDDDRTIIGNPTPDFIYGLTNTFSYKNFDLSVLCSGSYGNDVYVVLDQGAANLDGVFNVYKDVVNRWRSPENPGEGRYGGSYLGASTGDERDWGSDRFVEDGSYFAIKNITLGYNLPVDKVKFLKSVRLYGSIQQVAVFTSYRGVNPEVTNTNGGSTNTSALQLGFDWGSYPVPRTYTFGVNIGF
ncbi:TonB-dependent receptor [uncultured Draconibacterium sp.]|uniref:TonB-dependent receptor n=1 Tax=uncultured Draconibacterium sp. TaxID=1573823 RepID=UPI002AA6E7EE|nr:TonB-dependent receptor [uncultured Draconibacterium sp.]